MKMPLNPRKAKLLEELPKHNWKVKPAAIKAGYSPMYADKGAKRILKSALKDQAKAVIEGLEEKTPQTSKEIKRTLIQLLGLSSDDLYKRLKYIGFEQDKDLHTALKILAVLGKEEGFNLIDDTPKTIVPVLNIGVRENSPLIEQSTTTQEAINGSIEPLTPPHSE